MAITEPFDGAYFGELPEAPTGKRPRAPYEFLIFGFILASSLLIARVFGPAEWDFDLFVGTMFWVGSMAAFLLPFALFSEINLARQLNPDYRSNKESAKRFVFLFVVFGLVTSLVQVFFVSSLLARVLNVG